MNDKRLPILLFSLLFSNSFSQIQYDTIKKDSAKSIEEVVISSKQILGSKFGARNRTGSAYYIFPAEIQKMGYTDINRMLKAVPGVNIYEEDGYGLRPNISLRGTKAERSEKITIMEDGILAAPAPYAAPAAYYFPNAGRMYAVEVVKGSSQVQYGPFTTGGAVNMVSTPIPKKFSGRFNASYGTNNTLKTHANIGSQNKNFGYLVEYLRYQSDGFKSFEDGAKAGFNRNDFLSKLMFKTDKSAGINHLLELKFGYADENSDETYVGLSESDFRSNPFLRYAGSKIDQMTTKHQQWVATYLLDISKNFKITTNAYYTKFHRNWYKLNDIKAGITSAEKRSLNQVLTDPDTNYLYFDILTGKTDYLGEGLIVRANNRDYISRGLQTKAEYKFAFGAVSMDLEGGLRYHFDQEDRFQWEDGYSMQNKKMELFISGERGSNANRIIYATALSSYLLNKLKYRNLTVTAGLRYEDVKLLNKDYTKEDLRRTGKTRIETENSAKVLISSLGINYQLTKVLSVFSGIHKGFSPPSAEVGQKPESSVNVESGLRYSKGNLTAELIGFYNDYQNMLGSNLAAAGGTGELNQFDIGKAKVKGAEFLLQFQPIPASYRLKLPIQLSYTYTDTEMLNSFQEDSWSYVFKGDEIPYITKHSFNASLGAEYRWMELNLGIRYNGDMRSTPGQGKIAERELIPAYTIVDASAKVKINKSITLNVNAINLTNKAYLVSRHPAGLRAGHPFGIFSGMNVKF